MADSSYSVDLSYLFLAAEAEIADYFAKENSSRPNDFAPTNPSVINTVNVAIAPPIPTAENLQPTIEYAQAIAAASVAEFGKQETPLVVTLLETLDDAGALAEYLVRPVPAFWFGNIQVVMNGLTDAQRTTINSLDIGSQLSVTKSFPGSTPSTVTQVMALEGISHDITPDRHIVTLYPNPSRIYTYFIVGGYPIATTRTNLVTNPNFEVGTTGWSNINSATSVRTTSEFYVGTASLQTTNSATSNSGITLTTTGIVTAGQNYTLSGYIKTQTGTIATMNCFIVWLNSGGTEITRSVSSLVTASTSWQRISITGTAPAGTVGAALRFTRQAADTAGTVWFADGILFEQASSALPYFDGTYVNDYTGYGLASKTWNGTANASTSTASWFVGNTRTNLVTNPNFETNTTGWAASSGATITRTSTQSVFGSWSVSETRDSTTGNLSVQTFPRLSVAGSQTYTWSLYFRRDYSTTRTTQIRMIWYDSAGVLIGSAISSTITPPAVNTWGRFSMTQTAPSNAATVFCDVIVSSAIVGETIFVDGALLEASSTLLPYFDGTYADTYTGYTLTAQQWNGTANASTSTATWGLDSSFVGSELNDDTKGLA